MDPFGRNRWYDEMSERLAWHLFTLGVLGLLLLVLLISVDRLGEPPSIGAGPPMRTAIPVESEVEQSRSRHSHSRRSSALGNAAARAQHSALDGRWG